MKTIRLVSIAIAVLLVASCSLGVAYPDGRVTIKDVGERDDASGRSLVIQYAVSNAGAVAMNASTVSFSVETSSRGYWWSDARTVRVLPGATVYLSATVAYLNPQETFVPASVKVEHAFYE